MLDNALYTLSTPIELSGSSLMCNRRSPHGVYLRWKSLKGAELMFDIWVPLKPVTSAACSFLKKYPQLVILDVVELFPFIIFRNELLRFPVIADRDMERGVDTFSVVRLSVAALMLILVNSSST